MGRDLEQKRASFAFSEIHDKVGTVQVPRDIKEAAEIEKLIQEIDKLVQEADTIKSQACKAVALIYNSGFLNAMDFMKTKLAAVYSPLVSWLAKDGDEGPGLSNAIREGARRGELLARAIADASREDYCRTMEEAVAFLGQLKAKAEGIGMERKYKAQEINNIKKQQEEQS